MDDLGHLPPQPPWGQEPPDDASSGTELPSPTGPTSSKNGSTDTEQVPISEDKSQLPVPEDEPPKSRSWSRRARLWVGICAIVAPLLLLAPWAYAKPSQNLCGSCHTIEAAANSAATSVHSEVSCLSCHHRSGLVGAVTYLPTLIREAVHEATGLSVASGVLEPKPCHACHEQVVESEGHRSLSGECLDCHDGAVHPDHRSASVEEVHPPNYFRTHGRDSVTQMCTECHETTFCRACHARVEVPHPVAWITEHGPITVDQGTANCESCHSSSGSFCAGCHGTGVPHPDDWLSLHNQTDRDSAFGCTTCHTEDDCSICHAQHGVHNGQSLYDLSDPP